MYKFIKRVFDIICAILGIVGTSPVWLIAVIGIYISDPGNVFYFANRVGKDNKIFKMYKFRSMRKGVANEAVFRGDEDRIFTFGKFIRACKIDELPQLINVLMGQMSIVGPRPAAVDQVSITRAGKYSIAAMVQSGLTGPSALYDYIYGDSVTDADEYEKLVLPTRLELDVWYVENMSFGLDVKLVWWTIDCIISRFTHRNPMKIYDKLVSYAQISCAGDEGYLWETVKY